MKHVLRVAVLSLVCLAGCQNTVNTIENANKSATPQYIEDARFHTDAALKRRLKLKSLIVAKTSDQFTRAQVEITNVRTNAFAQFWSGFTKENPYRIRYKFVWMDANGMAQGGIGSDWQDAVIIPGETLYLQSVAPTSECVDFKISLVEAE